MRVAILGHFASGEDRYDGQTVKTRSLYDAFVNYTDYELTKIDTCGWKKRAGRLIREIHLALKSNEVMIILPASNGVKVFVPLINVLNVGNKCQVYYSVIGAWLPKMLSKNTWLRRNVAKLCGVWAETEKSAKLLSNIGLNNVLIFPNFKNIEVVRTDKKAIYKQTEKKLCTFSRVIREKGISNAIETVARLRERGYIVTLDVYGHIEEEYNAEFNRLLAEHSGYVKYKGVVDPNKSVSVLCDYYALLFPTLFYTEGVPGTVVDAFFAGLPVIASRWESCYDILNDTIANIYEMYDSIGLENAIMKLLTLSEEKYVTMTEAAYHESEHYNAKRVISDICSVLEKKNKI